MALGSVTELGTCDGPAGTDPHTKPTCADAACGVQEHHGAGTNEGRASGMTRKGGVTKRLAPAERGKEESDEEGDGDEEREKGGEEERERDKKEERGQSNAEPGEWLLPSRGEEDEEAAD
ncbi:hypothetical protein NDU88_001707 [Pleurodeles waltl]|uniref:Uncharacterized protein n=1 Tax=Pleurodeles waltl TaxID=8319 RepID=A0AAV7U7R8_PLEWA|nr:hypothetical protein NDU88_001707 [Pleurodeles waltl]